MSRQSRRSRTGPIRGSMKKKRTRKGTWLSVCSGGLKDFAESLRDTTKPTLCHGFRAVCVYGYLAALVLTRPRHVGTLRTRGELPEDRSRDRTAIRASVRRFESRRNGVGVAFKALADWFAKKNGVELTAQYDYCDADYKCGFSVLRFEDGRGKKILPVHAVPGGWSVGDPEGAGNCLCSGSNALTIMARSMFLRAKSVLMRRGLSTLEIV